MGTLEYRQFHGIWPLFVFNRNIWRVAGFGFFLLGPAHRSLQGVCIEFRFLERADSKLCPLSALGASQKTTDCTALSVLCCLHYSRVVLSRVQTWERFGDFYAHCQGKLSMPRPARCVKPGKAGKVTCRYVLTVKMLVQSVVFP